MQQIVSAQLLACGSYEGSTRLRNVHSRLLCHVPIIASAKVEVRRSMSRIGKRARAEVGTAKENASEDRYLALGLVAIMLSNNSFYGLSICLCCLFYILVSYRLDNSASPWLLASYCAIPSPSLQGSNTIQQLCSTIKQQIEKHVRACLLRVLPFLHSVLLCSTPASTPPSLHVYALCSSYYYPRCRHLFRRSSILKSTLRDSY
jgi:hypothetical protein